MTTGMVEALITDATTPSGDKPEMSMLPHLMPTEEIDWLFPIVRLDEGENQWAHALEGGITRPSEELADPGARGKLDFVPAMPGFYVFVIEDEKIIEVRRRHGARLWRGARRWRSTGARRRR